MDCKLNDFNNVVDRNYRNVNSDIGFFWKLKSYKIQVNQNQEH